MINEVIDGKEVSLVQSFFGVIQTFSQELLEIVDISGNYRFLTLPPDTCLPCVTDGEGLVGQMVRISPDQITMS